MVDLGRCIQISASGCNPRVVVKAVELPAGGGPLSATIKGYTHLATPRITPEPPPGRATFSSTRVRRRYLAELGSTAARARG